MCTQVDPGDEGDAARLKKLFLVTRAVMVNKHQQAEGIMDEIEKEAIQNTKKGEIFFSHFTINSYIYRHTVNFELFMLFTSIVRLINLHTMLCGLSSFSYVSNHLQKEYIADMRQGVC